MNRHPRIFEMSSPVAIVMAAGKGTRMKSDLPKVLFPVAGRPMIEYVLDALLESGVRRIVVVVGYRADLVREKLAQWHTAGPLTPALSQGEREKITLQFVEQSPQLGTGHAIMVCRPALQRSRWADSDSHRRFPAGAAGNIEGNVR